MSEKAHLSIVVCGHVDSGKSTTTGHLIYEFGGIPEMEMVKLRKKAEDLGKGSFAFAFYLDNQKEEMERGVTITCTTKEFFTEKYHYTVIDAPGHRDFIKNMISGAAQADVALLMVPADGFSQAIAKPNHKQGIVAGQTRQHSRLLNLLGVKYLIVGINKMDSDAAGYKKDKYIEIRDEMMLMLKKTGWAKAYVEGCVPILPISGWVGDNLKTKSDKMPWWEGTSVSIVANKLDKDGNKAEGFVPHATDKVTVVTLLDVLNNWVEIPQRDVDKKLRVPISGVFQLKGVGYVITGRVEQGVVKKGDMVKFLPTHSASNACEGKVFQIEMHHKQHEQANPGDNIGMNCKNLNANNMPKVGDVMVLKADNSLQTCETFNAILQTLDIPNQIKVGYSPIGFVRTGRSACRITKLAAKTGKETGGKKAESPAYLKANEKAWVVLKPEHAFIVDSFGECPGLSRIAFLDGNSCVMLGKVTKYVAKKEVAKK